MTAEPPRVPEAVVRRAADALRQWQRDLKPLPGPTTLWIDKAEEPARIVLSDPAVTDLVTALRREHMRGVCLSNHDSDAWGKHLRMVRCKTCELLKLWEQEGGE